MKSNLPVLDPDFRHADLAPMITRQDHRITLAEIAAAFDRQGVPPILSLDEAAPIVKLQPSTLKRKVSEGDFRGCVSRGKPLRFWRDRLIYRVMNPAD